MKHRVTRGMRAGHHRTRAIEALVQAITVLGEPGAGETEPRLRRIKADIDLVCAGRSVADPVVMAAAVALRGDPSTHDALLRLVRGQQLRLEVRCCGTFADWVDYEGLTAVPLGAVELGLAGAGAAEQAELADRTVIGARMLAALTMVGPHYRAGYVLLPKEDLVEFGVAKQDLGRATATQELRELVAFETTRALAWVDSGSLVVATLHGRARARFASRVAKGRATAAALRRQSCDPLQSSAAPGAVDVTRAYLTALVRRPG